jgi:hypothetical protein
MVNGVQEEQKYMKASEMAALVANYNDPDIFVKGEDGLLHDFKLEHRDMVFDGFDSVYNEGLNIVLID